MTNKHNSMISIDRETLSTKQTYERKLQKLSIEIVSVFLSLACVRLFTFLTFLKLRCKWKREDERRGTKGIFHLCVIKWIICVITAHNKTLIPLHYDFNIFPSDGIFLFRTFLSIHRHRRCSLCVSGAITLRQRRASQEGKLKSVTQLRKSFLSHLT